MSWTRRGSARSTSLKPTPVDAAEHNPRVSVQGLIGLTPVGHADVAARERHGWSTGAGGRLAFRTDRHGPSGTEPLPGLDSLDNKGSVVVEQDGTVRLRRQPESPAPIYWRAGDDAIAFDNQLERLARSATPATSFNQASLLHFLWRGRAVPRETLYSGIHSLLIGEELVCKPDSRACVHRDWWPLHAGELPEDDAELRGEVVRRLNGALQRRVGDSERVALLLSGGVDSSLLAALSVRQRHRLSAFTVAFDESYGLNETAFAQAVADANRIPHHVIHLDVTVALRLLDEVLRAPLPRPAPASVANDALIAAVADCRNGVVLSALGADECFGGYHKMLEYLAVEVIESNSGSQRGRTAELPGGMFLGIAEFLVWPELTRVVRDTDLLTDLFAADIAFYRGCRSVKPSANPLELMAAHEYQFRLAELLVPTFASPIDRPLPHIAYPFLDPSVYLWASALDPKHCFWYERDAWWAKRLLRRVALDFLPEDVVMRKRQVFLAPINHWLLDARVRSVFLEEIGDSALWKYCVLQPSFRDEILSGVRADDVARRSTAWQHKVWAVLVLCAWINRRTTGPPLAVG